MDHTGGYYMAMAILLALIHRKRTGEGQWVDLACTELALTLHGPALDRESDLTRRNRVSRGASAWHGGEAGQRFALWSGIAGIVPLPFVDLAAVGSVQVLMLRRISRFTVSRFPQTAARRLLPAWQAR